MTENERIQTLDRALEARLLRSDDPLLSIARDLVDMPSARFRTNFRRRLDMAAAQRTKTMPAYIRPGDNSVIPYLIVPDAAALIQFLKDTFNAEEKLRFPSPDGKVRHAALTIGDSVVSVADAVDDYPARTLPLHVYVEDADAAWSRAIAAGATSLREPANQPYGDREGSVRDIAGNNWYIATHGATGHKPVGMRNVTPYLHAAGAQQMIDFLEGAFGAEALEKYNDPDGRVAHCKLLLGDSMIELSDAHGPWQPMLGSIQIYLPDVDAAYARALELGAKSISAPEDKPYGDRMAGVTDFNGHSWFIASYLGRDA